MKKLLTKKRNSSLSREDKKKQNITLNKKRNTVHNRNNLNATSNIKINQNTIKDDFKNDINAKAKPQPGLLSNLVRKPTKYLITREKSKISFNKTMAEKQLKILSENKVNHKIDESIKKMSNPLNSINNDFNSKTPIKKNEIELKSNSSIKRSEYNFKTNSKFKESKLNKTTSSNKFEHKENLKTYEASEDATINKDPKKRIDETTENILETSEWIDNDEIENINLNLKNEFSKDDLKIGQVNESIEINYKNQIEINLNTKRLLSKSNGNFENITFNDKLTKFLSIFCSSRYSDNNIGF